jgi:hypothetical protein
LHEKNYLKKQFKLSWYSGSYCNKKYAVVSYFGKVQGDQKIGEKMAQILEKVAKK